MTSTRIEPPTFRCPPRFRVVEEQKRNDKADTWGDFAVDFTNRWIANPGESLYDWQEDVLRCWFQITEYDEEANAYNVYSHMTCGLIVPRQNGKTKWVAVPRMLIGAIFKGEQIRYSAQRVDTMLETFALCVEIVGNPDDPKQKGKNPDLYDYCKPKISFVNGHQKITFASGGVISFVSRSRDAGRGNTADINVFDEAQTLTDTQLADSLPNNAAAKSGNPQTIFIGTPPSPEREESGEAFFRIRKAAISETRSHCWHEWSVGEIGEVSDEDRWFATNPSLGLSLIKKKVKDDLAKMTPLIFAIEHLCYWSQSAKPEILDPNQWLASAVEKAPTDEEIKKKAVGIKFAPSGQVCASIAALKEDGTVHGELVKDVPTMTSTAGMNDLVNWIVERHDELALVAIDGKTGAGELYERLTTARTPKGKRAFIPKAVHVMKATEVPVAASMVMNGLAEKTITHYAEDEILNASALAAQKRKIGNDGLGFGGDSCPIESYAAAIWAVRTTKRDPSRKTRWIQ